MPTKYTIGVRSVAGSNSFATGQNALSTTAELLAAARPGRRRLVVFNTDESILSYVGPDSTVTSSTGQPVAAGDYLELFTAAAVYMIAASGTPTVTYIEEYD